MITIATVNYNTSEFIKLLLYSLQRLTFNDWQIIIADNNSDIDDFNNLRKITAPHPNATLIKTNKLNLKSGIAHGTALNELFPKITTKYGVIIDADCVFLQKNWDKILIAQLEKTGSKLIGAGVTSWYPKQRPRDFPSIFFLLFETATLKSLGVDFRPFYAPDNSKIKNHPEIAKELSIRFKNYLKDFDKDKFHDTGWHLRKKFQEHNLKAETVTTKHSKEAINTPFIQLNKADIFYLDNQILATHLGRSATPGTARGAITSPTLWRVIGKSQSIRWLFNKIISQKNINAFLIKTSIKKEKETAEKWLNICYKIINSEISRPHRNLSTQSIVK